MVHSNRSKQDYLKSSVYDTLMESDVVGPSGRTEGDTRTGRTRKKLEPKDLSVCETVRVRSEGVWREGMCILL